MRCNAECFMTTLMTEIQVCHHLAALGEHKLTSFTSLQAHSQSTKYRDKTQVSLNAVFHFKTFTF